MWHHKGRCLSEPWKGCLTSLLSFISHHFITFKYQTPAGSCESESVKGADIPKLIYSQHFWNSSSSSRQTIDDSIAQHGSSMIAMPTNKPNYYFTYFVVVFKNKSQFYWIRISTYIFNLFGDIPHRSTAYDVSCADCAPLSLLLLLLLLLLVLMCSA